VVDDDPRVRADLSRALEYEGFDVAAAADASGALREFRAAPPDLLVMESRLPDGDGLEVCRRLRDGGARVPILIVTGRDAVADRIAGLEAGADDYLVKPFSTAELIARVRALLRRRRDLSSVTTTRYADLVLDHATREVRRGGRQVSLTRREFDLLALFLANPESSAPARAVHEARGMPSSPRGWRHTWSAPASRCARTTSAIRPASPCGTIASIRRSEPPPARSSSSKPAASTARR
jgi:two-component system response regulator MprA